MSVPDLATGAQEPAPPPAAPARPAPRPWQDWAAWVAMAIAAAPRVWAAVWDQSIFYPDEIHQTLEQAHRFAFGYGMIPWEFRDAARSWVFPGIIGLYWKLLALLGVSHALTLVVAAKLLMAAAGVASLEVARRLASRLAGPTAGVVAVLLVGAFPLLIYFGARAMTEMGSAPLVLLAAYLALVAEKPRPALAGALASFSIFFRYQNGILAAGFFIILLARREGRAAVRFAVAGTLVALVCGGLDWITWKYPFQAFATYFKWNLIEGRASSFGTAPFGFFAEKLQSSVGIGLGVILLGLAAAVPRARALVAVVLAYFLIHSAVPHKELRFLMPVIPLAVTLAAAGLTELCERFSPGPRFALVVALGTAAALASKAVHPIDRDYGRNDSDWPLWHTGEDYFRVSLELESRPDVCGVAMIDNQPWWTGGYTYLHRNVPIYFDVRHLATTNYIIGHKTEPVQRGWAKVYEYGQYGLFRRDGPCAPDPHYKPYLN